MLIALDQLGNALAFGYPDETISSRLSREKKQGDRVGKYGSAILDALDPGHSLSSLEETPDGQIDSHHSGRVIHELPRDRLTKLRAAGFVILAGVLLLGCPIEIIVKPQPSPAPEVSPTPAPTPDPLPSATPEPSPAPSPSPKPSPTTKPSPVPSLPPSPGVPGVDATGNYPTPPEGVCPAWFKDSLARMGIQEHARRSCGQCVKDGYLGIIITASATPKSIPPFCGHASDRRECEQWRPCQDGYADWTNPNLGPDLLMTLPGHWTDVRCDKRSDNNYLCHHKPRREEVGVMTFKACPRGARPDDPRCGVSRPVRVQ